MSVIRLDLSYDGTSFRGWARQRGDHVRTVQGALEQPLSRVVGERVSLAVAGRTDAGVHASGQVASFEASGDVDLVRLRRAVNSMVGPEVVVRRTSFAPDGFHARYSATSRQYRYRIDTGEVPDPFTARFVWHRPGELSVAGMRGAARYLLGEHDFTAFCRSPVPGRPTVRRMQRVAVRRVGERVELAFRANAFLHQMVRSLVGTLVAVGEGRLEPGAVPGILASRDRSRAGQLAPAHGLTLEAVTYGRATRP